MEEGKGAAKEAASKAKNAAPDLSQGIFDRAQKSIGKISDEVGGALALLSSLLVTFDSVLSLPLLCYSTLLQW